MLPVGKKMIFIVLALLCNSASASEEYPKNHGFVHTGLAKPQTMNPVFSPLEELKAAKAKIAELEFQNAQLKKTQEGFVFEIMKKHQNLAESLVKEANGWGWGWWLRKSPSTLSSIAQGRINEIYYFFEAMHDKNPEKAKLTLRPFYTWQRELLSNWVKEQSLGISQDSPVFLALLTLGDDAYARGVYLGEEYYQTFFQDINRVDLYEEYKDALAIPLEKLKSVPKPLDLNLLGAEEAAPMKKRIPPAPKIIAKSLGKKPTTSSPLSNTKTSAAREEIKPNLVPTYPENFTTQLKNVKLKPVNKPLRGKEEDTMESALRKAFQARRMAIADSKPVSLGLTATEDEEWGD